MFNNYCVVEFPAVLLDVCSGEVVDTFQQYVLPVEQSTLSDFCIQLTGISQVYMLYCIFTSSLVDSYH